MGSSTARGSKAHASTLVNEAPELLAFARDEWDGGRGVRTPLRRA
jgi:hypothetical protein